MSDREYDALYDELECLENETEFILSSSPTQKVQGELLEGFEKVRHSKPMLSAGKTKSVDEIKKFIGEKEFYGSYKLDGLTLVVKYQNGVFVQATTRGNGEIGEDVTKQAKMIFNLPLSISYKEDLELRGECVISWGTFEKVNADLDGKYAHPRNLAAGSLRNLDTNIVKQRDLEFLVFECVSDVGKKSKLEILVMLSDIGFAVARYSTGTIESIIKDMKPELYQYPVDGLIFEFVDNEYSRSLGATGHHENCRMAFKWEDDIYETTLRDIEWNTTRTGIISPVAIFDEVDLDGALTTRATLHNISYMEDLDLGIGDRIGVYRANAVIPKVAENYTKSGNFKPPNKCPVCSGETQIKKDYDSKVLYCTNLNCTGKLLGRLTHFTSKNAMNIEGLSEATLEKFVNMGWIKAFADIYNLNFYKEEIVTMAGFGQKSYEKLQRAIEKSRNVKLENFIYAQGISNIGRSASKAISQYCNESINKFKGLMECGFDFSAIPDFGDVSNNSLHEWYRNANTDFELDRLYSTLNFIEPEQKNENAVDSPISGMKVYPTGTFKDYKKDEIKSILEKMGATMSSGYAKSLDYLIVGSAKGSGKVEKALQDGVKIMSEEEFSELFLKLTVIH